MMHAWHGFALTITLVRRKVSRTVLLTQAHWAAPSMVGYGPFEMDTSMDVGWRVGGAAGERGREGEETSIVRVSPEVL